MFEIYKAYKGRKTYIVASPKASLSEIREYAKRYFKCSAAHVELKIAYIYRDELYLRNPKPDNNRVRACWIAYYKG